MMAVDWKVTPFKTCPYSWPRHYLRGFFFLNIEVHFPLMWGTVPSVGNVVQPRLGKASGERGWWAGPTSMDKFSSGKSGLHCTLTAMRLALAKTPSPWGSKCLLSIFIFLKSGLDLPGMEPSPSTTSPFTLQISTFDVLSDTLSLSVKDNHPKQTFA